MNESKHLWEVKHPYYCYEGQYFSTQYNHPTIFEFGSFEDFLGEWGDADLDWNLLFRWDWIEDGADDDEDDEARDPTLFNGDIHYKNGELRVFFMLQRKGYHTCCKVRVCRADEPAVIEFLKPRMKHMLSLWAPLAPAMPA